jgi:formamidopyrimidine-DNA glycosylase
VPELPEVETIKDELLPWVVRQSFTEAAIIDAKLLRGGHPKGFRHELTRQMITGLERRGKYLVFHLSSGKSLIMHFRMTGRLLMNPKEIDSHARATFRLSNGIRLVFSDLRRLGAIWLVEDAEAIVGKLGPEPLGQSFTPHLLAQRLRRHHVPIKAAMIDQSVIAGIGNMYADEALFGAGIHPLRKADGLSLGEMHKLCHSIRQVLSSAIAGGGASVDTYVRPEGQLGRAQLDFGVAHREGQSCPRCSTRIQRISVRNRGSYFCPNCQLL